jgi:hypothetical protein
MRILEHIKARASGLLEPNGNRVSEGSTGCADGPRGDGGDLVQGQGES